MPSRAKSGDRAVYRSLRPGLVSSLGEMDGTNGTRLDMQLVATDMHIDMERYGYAGIYPGIAQHCTAVHG